MKKVRQIRAYSRPATIAKLDERTVEARMMREVRAGLEKHVGGSPSAAEKLLITQAVQLKLRLAMMDRALAESGAQNDHDSRTYLAHSSALGRTLKLLGLKPGGAVTRPLTADEAQAAINARLHTPKP